jgi:hypothetical protein
MKIYIVTSNLQIEDGIGSKSLDETTFTIVDNTGQLWTLKNDGPTPELEKHECAPESAHGGCPWCDPCEKHGGLFDHDQSECEYDK